MKHDLSLRHISVAASRCLWLTGMASATVAQVIPSWNQITPPTTPSFATHAGFAYDSLRKVAVRFGGSNPSLIPNARRETWEWNGADWTRIFPATSPSARAAPAMAYESARGRVLLFGGSEQFTKSDETWALDGSNWTQLLPANRPSKRDTAMVYDSWRDVVVLFGGQDYPAFYNDTWEFDGNDWTKRTPTISPPLRGFHAMAFDPSRGVTVMFGGTDFNNSPSSQTWEWDGNEWALRVPMTSTPPARVNHAMAYDFTSRRVVILGGRDTFGGGNWKGDSWAWDGMDWIPVSTNGVTVREGAVMATDCSRGTVVMHGGNAGFSYRTDTWELGTPVAGPCAGPPATGSVTSIGSGCAGSSGGVPTVDSPGVAVPTVGSTLTLEITGGPVGALHNYLFVLGNSNSSWGAIPLPLALAPFGAPGCTLWTSIDLAVVGSVSGGAASVSLGVPALSALVGGVVYCGGVITDPGHNPLGLIATNGLALSIGTP